MSANCPECEEGLPEWIMSYADMITILMAFFVVMYSMAGTDKDTAKQDAVLKSLREQFGPHWFNLTTIGPGPFVPQQNNISPTNNAAGGTKERNKKKGGAQNRGPLGNHPRVHTLRPGEQAAVGGIIYFSGDATRLDAAQIKQVQVAAEEVSGKPQKIEIRGHSSRRSTGQGSQDNWDLAYDRCRAVMQELVKSGIDPRRIRLSVAGSNEPIVRAGDPLAHAQSSRVEVFMLNEVADHTDQQSAGASPKPATKTE